MSPTIKNLLSRICLLSTLLCTNCLGKLAIPVSDDDFSSTTTSPAESADSELLITIIDVGQGDATLILGPETNGKRVSLLIDAGRLDPDGGTIVSQVLQDLGLTELNYTLLTHYDADHLGGFVTAYESTSLLWETDCAPKIFFPTDAMIDLGASDKDTDSVLEYSACRDDNQDLLSRGHIVIGAPAQTNIGYTIDLKGGYTATIVAGNGYIIDQDEPIKNVDTGNEESIATLISGPGGFNFLVAGDLTGQTFGNEDADVETPLAEALQARGIDLSVLHVNHHGSATSSNPGFLSTLTPEVAVISVGENHYGHPNCDTIANLQENADLILQTEAGSVENCANSETIPVANGNILITVQNAAYSIQTPAQNYACTTKSDCQ